MDLKKELEIIRENGNAYEIFSNLRDQQIELEKKKYILQIADFANYAEKLYKENVFQNSDIAMISLNWYHQSHIGNGFDYVFKDALDNTVISSNPEDSDKLSEFAKKTGLLMGFNKEFINESFQEQKIYTLEVDKNLKENLLKLLLSNELKSILDYNELDIDIRGNPQIAGKKNKI